MSSDQIQTGPVTRWLIAGPGFALVVLLFSSSVTLLITTYISNQQIESRTLSTRIAALSAIRAEADDNLNRTRYNVKSIKQVLAQPGTYPGLEPYIMAAWRTATISESMLTLKPEYFMQLATLYENLEETNFDLSTLRAQLLRIDVRSLTPEQYRLEEENRKKILMSLLERSERLGSKGSIPSAIIFADELIRVTNHELDFVEYWIRRAQWVGYVLLAVFLLAVAELFNRTALEGGRRLISRFRKKTLLDQLDEIGRRS